MCVYVHVHACCCVCLCEGIEFSMEMKTLCGFWSLVNEHMYFLPVNLAGPVFWSSYTFHLYMCKFPFGFSVIPK